MNDPWDVKCVRQGHQYQSLMKINGVPLLPPVLSKECRKEMQYYKLLAKEVEKRIMILRPYVETDSDSSEDKINAILPASQQKELLSPERKKPNLELVINDIAFEKDKYSPRTSIDGAFHDATDSDQDMFDSSKKLCQAKIPIEVPERDCDYKNKRQRELLTDMDIIDIKCREKTENDLINDIINFDFNSSLDTDDYIPLKADGPSSLSSKSFTGSLHDLHSDSTRESLPLVRQRSYTLLKPSPQLLAHLEIQSICTGVEVTSISMSDSLSNKQNKKRRSWDLESAKLKWSTMAQELQKTTISRKPSSTISSGNNNVNIPKKLPTPKANSVAEDKTRKPIINARTPKSEPIQRPKSPARLTCAKEKENTVEKSLSKEPPSPTSKTTPKHTPQKSPYMKKQEKPKVTPPVISNTHETAARVKELYEKLQKQQLMQMTSLMEKQKKEQEILQKVFEEQNNILLKQLKTVCPKAPIEIKQAWGDLKEDINRGPVSLSQLINHNPPDLNLSDSPVSKTLTETNIYINKCDKVLRTSRDITNSIKKLPQKSRTPNRNQKGEIVQAIQSLPEGSRTRSCSPNVRNASRRLNYDISLSSETSNNDLEPMLTDRTNDTMADLNVTFPSDSDENRTHGNDIHSPKAKRQTATRACSPHHKGYSSSSPSTDTAIRHLEDSIQSSVKANTSHVMSKPRFLVQKESPEQRAAATKIVASAKGYLVRRLMRTERVQGIVQTIQDALLCALQLHQDREGIRGADVDLHRRLIQQITAACYSLHDAFVASTPAERCALIAADRARKQALAVRQPTPRPQKRTDIMSQSHSGVFPARAQRKPASIMTMSNYETFSGEKTRSAYMPSPRRRPWR